MIGVFDSGLGGLTVVRQIRARLPDEDVLFLADQANVPYGDRSDAELARLLAENVAVLDAANVDAIVMGCNTSCAVAARLGWPRSRARTFDLIAHAADAVAASGARRVGVVATAATTRSGAYGDAIRARDERIRVTELAAPRLVPLVEAGTLAGPVARAAVAEALAGFGPLDALVLACTHYPLLDAHFAALLGPGVVRIDPAVAQAERAADFVRARGRSAERGRTQYVTTGDLAAFAAQLATLVEMGPEDRIGARPGSVPSDEPEEPKEDEHGNGSERRTGEHLQHGVRA